MGSSRHTSSESRSISPNFKTGTRASVPNWSIGPVSPAWLIPTPEAASSRSKSTHESIEHGQNLKAKYKGRILCSRVMAYHGVQLLGIAIVLTGLAAGHLSFAGPGTAYVPNTAVAISGLLVSLVGMVVDPILGRTLSQKGM